MENLISYATESQQTTPTEPTTTEPTATATTEPQMGTIYKIVNTLNGKGYVGQTRQKLNDRIRGHKSSKKKSAIDAAIAKYGWENFTVEVLETCPVELLNERERFFICEHDTKVPNGYNLTDGGDTGFTTSEEARARISANHADASGENNGFYGKRHSAQARAAMSAAKKNKPRGPLSQETRAKIAAKLKGRPSPSKGKPSPKKGKKLSLDTRAKMSAAHKGKHLTEEQRAFLSEINSGENHPMYGKHHTPESRAKMSAAQRARWARKKAVESNGGS